MIMNDDMLNFFYIKEMAFYNIFSINRKKI